MQQPKSALLSLAAAAGHGRHCWCGMPFCSIAKHHVVSSLLCDQLLLLGRIKSKPNKSNCETKGRHPGHALSQSSVRCRTHTQGALFCAAYRDAAVLTAPLLMRRLSPSTQAPARSLPARGSRPPSTASRTRCLARSTSALHQALPAGPFTNAAAPRTPAQTSRLRCGLLVVALAVPRARCWLVHRQRWSCCACLTCQTHEWVPAGVQGQLLLKLCLPPHSLVMQVCRMSMEVVPGEDSDDNPVPGMLAQLNSGCPAGCAIKELTIVVGKVRLSIFEYKESVSIVHTVNSTEGGNTRQTAELGVFRNCSPWQSRRSEKPEAC